MIIIQSIDELNILQMQVFREKLLVQVEGPTCCGKTTIVTELYKILKRNGYAVVVLEEAATEILGKNDDLLNKLKDPNHNIEWNRAKIELQQLILTEQIKSLKAFAENETYSIALMDRGGASTAYHTLTCNNLTDPALTEDICKQISQLATVTLLLPPLGFINYETPRYQKNIKEIEAESLGIQRFLDKWGISYNRIDQNELHVRIGIALKYVMSKLTTKIKSGG